MSEQILRADDARIACPLFQEEYGGVTPTSALQLRVCKIAPALAMRLNRQWHSRLPEIPNYRMCQAYGAECGNVYYAVALWSTPSNQNLFNQGCYELRRFAISSDAPKNTASRMLRIMVKFIRSDLPNVKRLVSYQDTEVHSGTIYKASGWVNAGKTHNGAPCGWKNNVRFRPESNGTAVQESVKQRWDYLLTTPTPVAIL